jgi:hypothetical protein
VRLDERRSPMATKGKRVERPTLWCPDCGGEGDGEWCEDGDDYPDCERCDGTGRLPRAVVLSELRSELRQLFATANARDTWEGYAALRRQVIEAEVGNDRRGYAAMEWESLGIVPAGLTVSEIIGPRPDPRWVVDPGWPSPRRVRRMVYLTLPDALRSWNEFATFHVVDGEGAEWDVTASDSGEWSRPHPCAETVHSRGRYTKDELADEAESILILIGRSDALAEPIDDDEIDPEWAEQIADEREQRRSTRDLYWRTVPGVQRYLPTAPRPSERIVSLRCPACGCRHLWPTAYGLVPDGDHLVPGITSREPAEVMARRRALPKGGFVRVDDTGSTWHLERVACPRDACSCHTPSEPADITAEARVAEEVTSEGGKAV